MMKVSELDIPGDIRKDLADSGITELNPPQKQSVNSGLLDGRDMVIAAPTASGKTLIAELALSKQVVENEKKAIYIVPLKALASEKYQDFKERYKDLDVRMAVGNKDEAGERFETADVVVATSEKLDSMLRHNPSWIHDIGLVVVDEIHLLTSPNRGPTLEVTISRLREILDFQMLGLSATISNSDELADWLDAELVESDYRPVDLKHGVYWQNEIEFYPEDVEIDLEEEEDKEDDLSFSTGKEIIEDDEEDAEADFESEIYSLSSDHGRGTLNIIEDTFEMDKQAIVFCSSRKGAEKSADRSAKLLKDKISREERNELKEYAEKILNVLGSPTSQCKRLAENVEKGTAFHHAGLLNQQRQLVEEAFRKGLIKTISATPTLAAGVNLPAFRVIIRDLKRYTGQGMDFIPVLEYEQMCLPYDQKVLLADGERKEIGDIVESKAQVEVLSYNQQKHRLESKEVTEHYSGEKSTILEIKTETGKFELTGNHPVLSKKDDNINWVKADSLEKGDLIQIQKGSVGSKNPFFYKFFPKNSYAVNSGDILVRYKERFNLTDEELAENLGISSSAVYHYKNDRKAVPLSGILQACKALDMSEGEISEEINEIKSSYGNTIEIPKKATKNFMWLLGIIITDGNLNKTEDSRHGSTYTSIRVFNTNKDIIEKAKSIFNSLGLRCYEEEREEGKYRLEVGNTLLAEVMNEKFDIPYGNKSQKTSISEIIFQMPIELQASFIEGVFDGDGSYYEKEYKQRVHFSTSSEKFAEDLREILASLGVKSRLNSKTIGNLEIKGNSYEVNSKSYFIKVRSKDSINKLADLLNPVKAKIEKKDYSSYHNSNEHLKELSNYTEVLDITEKEPEKVYNIEVKDNHNYLTSSREILHNCGRAGRPKYDDRGEAISIAKQPGMKEDILDRYILGEPEKLQSKLAVEPVLRMHTLSLVASKFCTDMEQLLEFYSETLYAHQFGDMKEVESKIRGVVESLRDWDFLKDNTLEATNVGERVSELYLDPDSAHLMLESLEKADETDTKPISYLFMISRTTEMKPRLRVKDKEYSDIGQAMADAEKYILEPVPDEWESGFDSFLESMKTAMMLQGWISEIDEERLMDKYGIAPGGVRAKTQNADWLLYGAQELSRMKQFDVQKDIERLRVRLKHGIEEDLLNLVEYDQIGRVRARELYDHGIRDREQIREVSFEKLKKLIGKKTARKLKKQVGEENIFDRENITDYF